MAEDKYRPAPEHRWVDGMRTEPVHIAVRTEWLYSEGTDALLPEGRTRHPFGRGGDVVASDVPSPHAHQQDLASHIHRAVSAFGDDKDLIIEVRLAEPATSRCCWRGPGGIHTCDAPTEESAR